MPLFEQALPVNREDIASLASSNWNLVLGDVIKVSQNHTFQAHNAVDPSKKYIIRVTPDPERIHAQRVRDEIFFVCFLTKHPQALHHVCAPVPLLSSTASSTTYLLEESSMLIVAYEWALGAPLNFMDFSWMTKPEIAYTWGKWFGHFHQLSRKFTQEYPEVSHRIQQWSEIHHGILRDASITAEDLNFVSDPNNYGILHGDLNISNFYYLPGVEDTLSVFDWDQVQQGWFLYDVAQAAFTVYMLAENGSLADHSKVPEADPVAFENNLLAGYASVVGEENIDRNQYHRMVQLRMYFYETFCRQAKKEGNVPADMAFFIEYILHWFDSRGK